jgi:leucyl-tRNA synthetase
MSERRKQFPFHDFEPRWQAYWEKHGTFRTPNPEDPDFDPERPKYYVLDMFPYPSGAGLHVGHPEGYTATDIMARYRRMNGFNVLHPMGWDAFGLPAEQHAIKTGEHPRINTEQNINNFRRQLKRLGFSYDWEREINTTDPTYVRWTQWIFLQLYHSYYDTEARQARPVAELEAKGWSREQIDAVRLAYVDEVPVNWSPDLGTVLANEEVEEWRSKGHTVERRPLKQWMLRITAYADRLINELEGLDWPEGIKLHQRNWIGRSEGAEADFTIGEEKVTVFTTRPDTLFGATYMVLSPEHPLVDRITTAERRQAVEAYRTKVGSRSDLERTELNKEKTGEQTGAVAINPMTGGEIPVWIADYVLMSYGTGAIMAVPAHDERDLEFATKFELPVIQVVEPPAGEDWRGFTGEGTAINSGLLDGLPTAEAKARATQWLEERELGRKTINFKLRDWLFSRQRYWGEPFPIEWDASGRHRAIPEEELPLLAPELDDYKPSGSPEPLLSKAIDWVDRGDGVRRETNTMPQWAGSCWYYLRYCDAANPGAPISTEAERYWMGGDGDGGVDLYVGGTEHAVLHLLYARFWHKVLYDLGHLSKPEPFQRLVNQGLIMGEDGQKMSKSRGNVVNPDDVVDEYGADALRLYEMFMGPLEQVKPWSMKGVEGVYRFLARVWRVVMEEQKDGSFRLAAKIDASDPSKDLLRCLHQTIEKVTSDTEKMSFNTAISQMMVYTNALTQEQRVPAAAIVPFLALLSPYAPHMAEELYQVIREKFPAEAPATLASDLDWPVHDPAMLVEDEIELVVQVNGKVRDRIRVARDLEKEAIEQAAVTSPKVAAHLEGLTIRKVIVVPGRLINVVAN